MAKKKTIKEQIEKMDIQINAWENKIATMKEERKELVKQQRESDLKNLYQTIQHKGLDISQVFDIINNIK